MIIAATSLAEALQERYDLIDAARRNSRNDARQALSMCCRVDNVQSSWTPRYKTDILKGTLFPSMFAHSLSTKPRRDAQPTASVLAVFSLSLLRAEHHPCMFEYRTEHCRDRKKVQYNTKELFCPYFSRNMVVRLLLHSVHIKSIVLNRRYKSV